MFTRAHQLEVEEEFYASQDAIRERYACQIEDARREMLIYQEEQEYMTKVWEAGYGTDCEAYEAYWKRVFQYYEQHESIV
tara:strand:- start:19 stop:258 length:240 start_codon:yes stop_codon:yes gene_type:complete